MTGMREAEIKTEYIFSARRRWEVIIMVRGVMNEMVLVLFLISRSEKVATLEKKDG